MSVPVVVAEKLTKRYGRHRGIESLDLLVHAGEVFGFLGPNGAGKTTTIRTLLDFIRPSSGRASILGFDCQERGREIRARVGYLPGEFALYEQLTGSEMLRFIASLRGGVDWSLVENLARRLSADLSRRIGDLSHGNKQKIGIILAFMSQPPLLILDEPTSGLDPLVQREFYAWIAEVREQGRTVFFSSHVLPEVERVCDRVGIIREGRLIRVESVAEIKASLVRRVEIQFVDAVSAADFEGVDGIQSPKVEGRRLQCTVRGSMDALLKRAARFSVADVVSREPDLEEYFMALYGNDTDAG